MRSPLFSIPPLTEVTPALDDYVAIADTSDSGNNKKALVLALPWPKGYVYGFRMAYASATTFTVEAGDCIDSAAAANITLASQVTVDITTLGAALGLDRVTATATATTHGTATFEPSASLYSETALSSTVRTGTGTISTTTTAMTGSGTKFLTELAIHDVVRSASNGASRVTAIASDTAATLAAALPGGNASAQAFTVYENLIVWPDTGSANDQRRVNTITHAGTSVVLASAVTSNGASKVIAIGSEIASAFYFVWVVSGASGTTCILSSQRTTPYGVTGYTTSVRRIGVVANDASGNITPFDQNGNGSTRNYQLECAATLILSAGAGTAWTAFLASSMAPPTATRILISPQSAGALQAGFRSRNAGVATLYRGWFFLAQGQYAFPPGYCACDGAQGMDYVVSGSNINVYIAGYEEPI